MFDNVKGFNSFIIFNTFNMFLVFNATFTKLHN